MREHQTYMVSNPLLEGWCRRGVHMRVIVDVIWMEEVDHKEVWLWEEAGIVFEPKEQWGCVYGAM